MPATGGPCYYRRALPGTSVAFSSAEGRALFREALVDGCLESYFPLAEQLHTQAEPAFCGLATLVMVLNALAVDPGVVWKGVWRWYHEGALACCKPIARVMQDGIDLDEFVCLARCQGVSAALVRADEQAGGSLDAFRAVVERQARSTGATEALVVSYSREALGQTGDGHFSPIGGYHRARDLCLILDTARFKYPPHWVPTADLWEAMRRLDRSTGKPRGFVRVARPDLRALCTPGEHGACFRVGLTGKRLQALRQALRRGLSAHAPPAGSPPEAQLAAFARALPEDASFLVTVGRPACVAGGCGAGGEPRSPGEDACAQLVGALRQTRAYGAIAAAAEEGAASGGARGLPCSAESATVLALVLGRAGALGALLPRGSEALWRSPLALREARAALEPGVHAGLALLERELEHSREQITSVVGCVDGCCEPAKPCGPVAAS